MSVWEHMCLYVGKFQVGESFFFKEREVKTLNSVKTFPR